MKDLKMFLPVGVNLPQHSSVLCTGWFQIGLPSIGGKDSMSGTFEDIDVPPTLVSFAVAMTKASKTISTEFKNAGSKVIFVPVPENKETLMPVWDKLIEMYNAVYALCEDGKVLSASGC